MENKKDIIYFLAIDPSISSTGISVLSMNDDNKFLLHYKTSLIPKTNKETDRTRFKKKYALYDMFSFCLDHIQHNLRIDLSFAIFEDYSYGSIGHLAHLGELNGIYKLELAKRKIEFDVIAPSSIKKIVTGSGKATKDEVAKKLPQFVLNYDHFKFNNNDETDSVAVGVAYAILMTDIINEPKQDTKKD